MSMNCKRVYLVAGDNNPAVRIQLLDHHTGAAINLLAEATTVHLRVRELGTDETIFEAGPLTKVDGGVDGFVAWQPDPDDIDLDPAVYEGQVYINDGSDNHHTCRTTIHIHILEKFGAAT